MGLLRGMALSATITISSLTSNQALANNLVINGSFETGNTTGWFALDGTCDWESLMKGQATAQAGSFVAPTPTNGNWVLLSDASEPGACTLLQDVTLPSGTSDMLTLDAGYNYLSFGDPTGPGCSVTVAVTTTGGVPIATVYSASGGNDQAIAPQPPVDLTASAGTTVRIIVTTVSCDDGPAGVILDNVVLNSKIYNSTAPDLNQHGLTGSWYEQATNGQGVEVEVFPNPSSGTGSTFVSWFTYDTVIGGPERQRWYTAQGPVVTGQPNAALTIYQNTGGNFNAPPMTTAQPVGTATLSFSTCSNGQLSYSFTDGSGRMGTIPLTRLTQNVTCSTTTPFPTNADFALSGNWYGGAATSGQGFTAELNPNSGTFFSAWYTYEPMGADAGAAGQRWYTAQGTFTPGLRSITVTIYETTGGMFDAPPPPGQKTVAVGSGTMAFQSCTAATFSYSFIGGSSGGRSGIITLSRVGPIPLGCT